MSEKRWCTRCHRQHTDNTAHCPTCKEERRAMRSLLTPEQRQVINATKRAARAASKPKYTQITLTPEELAELVAGEGDATFTGQQLSFIATRTKSDARGLQVEDEARTWNTMRALYESGVSSTEVGTKFGITDSHAWKILKRINTKMRDRGEAVSAAMLALPVESRGGGQVVSLSTEQVAEYERGASLASLAKKIGCGTQGLKSALERQGVHVRSARDQWALMFNPDGSAKS